MPLHVQLALDDEERRLLAILEAAHAEVLAAEAELSKPTELMLTKTYKQRVETLNTLRLKRDEARRALWMHRKRMRDEG